MVPLQRLCEWLCPRAFYGWCVVGLCGLGVSCSAPGDSYFFLCFVKAFVEDVGIARTTVASLWSSSLVLAACTAPFGGNLIDRYGSLRILTIIAIPYCAAVAVFGRVQSETQLFAAIFIVRSLGPGWMVIAFNKLFNGWWRRRRGRAAAVLGLFGQLRILVVPALLVSIEANGWRSTYPLFAAIILATLALVLPNVRDRAELCGLHPDGDSCSHGATGSPPPSPSSGKPDLSAKRVLRTACRTPFFLIFCCSSWLMSSSWGEL